MHSLTGATLTIFAVVAFGGKTHAVPPSAATFDCSEAYGGQAATCRAVPCPAEYASFKGVWEGPFFAFDRSLGHFRPLHNATRYDGTCAENIANRDTFTIGRETNTFEAFEKLPAKVEEGLLVFGQDAAGKPFLRTVGAQGVYAYASVYRNPGASLSIWQLDLPAANGQPELSFATIDGRNPAMQGAHERQVTVTMRVGPAAKPRWEGVVLYGAHTQRQ